MSAATYTETFDEGHGGWIGWDARGAFDLEITDGVAISRGPWWVDCNHAPPGGGYLHLLYCLHTGKKFVPPGTVNRFVEGGYPLNFTNAKVSVRIKGKVETRSTNLVLLAQAKVGDTTVNSVLSAQPIRITPDWSEQTIVLEPEDEQWTCLGSRHDRQDFYGWGKIADVLNDLNVDIIFVFHPLDIVPADPIEGDPHILRAGQDYPVDLSRLPHGEVHLDQVKIEFSQETK